MEDEWYQLFEASRQKEQQALELRIQELEKEIGIQRSNRIMVLLNGSVQARFGNLKDNESNFWCCVK